MELAQLLSGIKGKFLLSINDNKEMREVFKAFRRRSVSLLYSMGKKPVKAKELLIQNF